MTSRRCVLVLLTSLLLPIPGLAETPTPEPHEAPLVALSPVPEAASGRRGTLDPAEATRAYLATLSGEKKAKSDAYFEGGYWLLLWSFLVGAAVNLLLLHFGLAARMRDRAERRSRRPWLQTAHFYVEFSLWVALLSFPLSLYQDFFREHQYHLSNLTLGGWLLEELKGLGVSLVLGTLAITVLYALVRKLPRTWWLWGAGVTTVFLIFGALIAPVLIVPIFNHAKPLTDARIVKPILSLARANGIPAQQVWEVDASKQSTRVSANVSGFLGTERITLNDNLLARGSLPEIQAIMGHEMGHYVLNHIYKMILEFAVLLFLAFALLRATFEKLRVRFERRWKVRGVGDVAGLPLALTLLSAFFFVLTPVLNSLVRSQEYEADVFGLNASGQPDGFAQGALQLSDYRKLEPGPLEEMIFYDHPSGRTRIFTAMRWKAEHPETWAPRTP